MGKKIDLTGQRFGMWTVLKESPERDKSGSVQWYCRCDCGTIRSVAGASLRKGKSTCCGCTMQNKNNDMIGKKFGMLTVLEKTNKRSSSGSIIWKCKCDCGNICERSTIALNRDTYSTCGCYNKNINLDLSIIGQRFGKLVVKDFNYDTRKFICKCDCGNTIEVIRNSLITGNTSSCGCINYSIGEKHIEEVLKINHINFKSQYTNKELELKKFDFAILDNNNDIIRLIEFDGQQHFNDLSGLWNSTETLDNIQTRDKIKNQWAREHNIPLVRIPYTERDKITLEMIMGDKYLIT